MFGDILFSTVPFSIFDDGEAPEPYAQIWINQCPAVSAWENQDLNQLPTANCHKDK